MKRRKWGVHYKLLVLFISTFTVLLLLMRDLNNGGNNNNNGETKRRDREKEDSRDDKKIRKSSSSSLSVEARSLFVAMDSSSDGRLNRKELIWAIQRKMSQHMQSAIRGNMQNFIALDRIKPNGQVDWDEWEQSVLLNVDSKQQDSRAFKEKMAAARAAWKDAARSNPESLNIDEFLSFTHSEFSHPLRIQEADEMMSTMDANGDGSLSLVEFVGKKTEDQENREEELKRRKKKEEEFSDVDVNSDGSLSRSELMGSMDPKGEVWAKQRAEKVFLVCDRDGDDFIGEDEFEVEEILAVFPEKLFHDVF